MPPLTVVAHHATPTNMRLGRVVSPGRAVSRLRPGDVALGRLDVLPSLDGIEPGLLELAQLEAAGVTVLNGPRTLVAAHDKLATAHSLAAHGLPHPLTVHVAPWTPDPAIGPPLVLKPRFGSWGTDVVRCDDDADVERELARLGQKPWYHSTGGIAQELVPPLGFDLRLVVARGRVVGAVRRIPAPGEWRTNVALGARRTPTRPPRAARELAIAAAAAVGGGLVGVDLLPAGEQGWTVLEVNGAVEFTSAYSLDEDVFDATRAALRVVEEALA